MIDLFISFDCGANIVLAENGSMDVEGISHIWGMALILPVNGKLPQFGADNFMAENATIVGDVICGDQCSFWFQSVVRGDVNSIRIGNKVNVQDAAIIHCTYEKAPTQIGNNVSIGHGAIIHGCSIESNVLLGMRSVVMDQAIVHENSVIGAGAIVLEGTVIDSGSVWAGVPAKKVKDISEEQVKELIERIADNYVLYSSWF